MPCEQGHRSCAPPSGTLEAKGGTAGRGFICSCPVWPHYSEKILCAWLIKSGLLSNFRVGVCICGLSSSVQRRLEVLHTFLSKKGRKTKTKERRQRAKDTAFTFLHCLLSRQVGEATPTGGIGGTIWRSVRAPVRVLWLGWYSLVWWFRKTSCKWHF